MLIDSTATASVFIQLFLLLLKVLHSSALKVQWIPAMITRTVNISQTYNQNDRDKTATR